MKIKIIIQGDKGNYLLDREFQGDYHELHNRDWDERVHSMLDDAKAYEDGELPA